VFALPEHRLILTVDVEDYFQVSGFASRIRIQDWDRFPLRVEQNTDRLLSLFDRLHVRATFFILGWVADKVPDLVRRIALAGHEIASHGYWHQLVYDLTPDQFREDLIRSRASIGAACGIPVCAYRAPSFSITNRSWWALEVLASEGFTQDSSVFPVRHDRYGVPDSPKFAHTIQTPAGPVREYPMTCAKVGGLNVPVGGGYFRALPFGLTRRAIKRTLAKGGDAMFYIHPWEVDPAQPRISGVRWKNRFRHYVNLSHTMDRLERLLRSFPCTTLGSTAEKIPANGALV
jgi:polysaccharide deacetylase family protein (PEP-CTERM system associated)